MVNPQKGLLLVLEYQRGQALSVAKRLFLLLTLFILPSCLQNNPKSWQLFFIPKVFKTKYLWGVVVYLCIIYLT